MSKQIQLRRGTTVQHETFTGVEGECTVDTTKDTLVVHDGTTAGGHPLSKDPSVQTLTEYSIASTPSLPSSSDTINEAIGKLAKQLTPIGILKSNGTVVSAATAGTDYLNTSDIINTLVSTSTTDALSANMGKSLQDTKSALPAAQVLTEYAIAETASLPASTDTINSAIGKLSKTASDTTSQLAANMTRFAAHPSLTLYENYISTRKYVLFQSGSNIYAIDTPYGALAYKLYKSTNYGVTWTVLSQGKNIHNLIRLSSGTLIAVDTTPKVFRSTDDGATWTEVTPAGLAYTAMQQGVTETPSGYVLIAEYGNNTAATYKMYRSTDDGQTFTECFAADDHPGPDAAHIHYIQYDSVADKLVAQVDGSYAYIVSSDDEGATWTEVGQITQSYHPNSVALMFFADYIAWGPDENAVMGYMFRIKRSDFYSGNWSAYEHIVRVNQKMLYFTLQMDTDIWLISGASESNYPGALPGSYNSEVYAVYDNGSKVEGVFESTESTAYPGSLVGQKVMFPLLAYNATAERKSVLQTTNEQKTGFAIVPFTLGVQGFQKQITRDRLESLIDANLFTPDGGGVGVSNNQWVTFKDTNGAQQTCVGYDTNNRLHVRRPVSGHLVDLVFYEDDRVRLVYNGIVKMRFDAKTGAIGVGNSANATTLGNVVKKIEIFDATSGTSIGFIPVYDSIT